MKINKLRKSSISNIVCSITTPIKINIEMFFSKVEDAKDFIKSFVWHNQDKIIKVSSETDQQYKGYEELPEIEDTKFEESETQEFTLPDNLFDERVSKDSKNLWIEGIKCDKHDKSLPKHIAELINSFADNDYIDDDLDTKETFAFRLTGRKKPKRLIEKIKWYGENYTTLLYFIKKYSNKYGKYKRFEKFLCLEIPFNDQKTDKKIAFGQYSSYAETCPNDELKEFIDENFS